jgi:deoxycytidine triphosphate deaminase
MRDDHRWADFLALGGRTVPTLITTDHLREAVTSGTLITDGDPENVEGIKYDFQMGSRVLKAKYSQPIDMNELPAVDRSAMSIDPGEVVFVLTKEHLHLSKDVIAILSPKRKLAHSGIIILGGLAVDPLYDGPLWIGLYNISSTPFPLMPGRKLIAALFYRLSEQEIGEFAVPESAGTGDFPDELINLIQNYKPVELRSLAEELSDTRARLA